MRHPRAAGGGTSAGDGRQNPDALSGRGLWQTGSTATGLDLELIQLDVPGR